MKEIVFVTHNKGKVASAQEHFKKTKLEIFNYDLDEPRSDDVKEIATAKVLQAYNLVKKPCIALDAGFFIEALNGFPRAFTNFALETIGIDGILKLMENIHNRKCYFKDCLAYYDGKEIKYFFGYSEGNLAKEIRGKDTSKKWSDLWYIFCPSPYDKTFTEMNDEDIENRIYTKNYKNSIKDFAKYLEGDDNARNSRSKNSKRHTKKQNIK